MDRRRFIGYSVAAAFATSLPYGRTWAAKITGDVAAIRSGGGAATLAASDLQQLKDSLRGALLLPGDPGYDVARHVRNQSIDKHPALIIQPSGAADVRTAVDFAREKDLLLAVKCGGHSYAGKSTCDGGMQIDLSSHARRARRYRQHARPGSMAAACSANWITRRCRSAS